MKYLYLTAFCAAACAAGLAVRASAADWKFSTSVNYDTGEYGTSERTDSVYIPLTLKRYYSSGDVSVTVPYLRQSSTGKILRVGGNPVRIRGNAATLPAGSSESGLGDIVTCGRYTVLEEGPRSFDLSLAGKLKLPTASAHKGLGTGEFDEGAGLEFAKKAAPGWTLLADGYYTIIGEPSGVSFRNQLSYDIGFYRPLEGNIGLTVLYETSSPIVSGNPRPRHLSGTLDYKSPDGNNYFCGLLLGLSDGSPDIGLSAGLSRRF